MPLAACSVLLAGAVGCSDPAPKAATPSASGASTAASASAAVSPGAGVRQLEEGYQRVIEDVLPSVVQINARSGLGSGVVYDDKGHVVTNAHVVGQEKAFKVTVATEGGAPVGAKLVATYPEQDLAVVKLDKVPDGLKAARFGDSAKVAVGQIVLAMGSPLGLSSSVTQGIVSAVGRTVTEPAQGGGPGATIGNMVQTSAAINPGNSGGALVDLDGQVIGIPTLAATDPGYGDSAAPGIGFAIPASMVKTVADQIIKDGRVTDSGRAALGISGRTVLGDDFQPAGVAVAAVQEGGAAAKAGIRAGDVLVGFDGGPVATITALSEALASSKPGAKVKVAYQREGVEKVVEVTLGEM
ncbi:trypsin-like peptidase domain-containing protein [Streptomyces sp. NBC_00237]|uniref:S1C family serine protease n=1 Tax=Streptomyces sp. NBC_00237 TaxID=2975687 RepID=UPI0022509921|nr:trypsin-like peptidase domain-containing protein [Streptomyces sp. NBC_00237]MCX5201694.1 trypsin-like peptidase domain-containing protein [Streptomyces sp. NBC_00237]